MARNLAKLGEGGRLVIPAEYRKALGLHTGDEVMLVLEEGAVRIQTPQEAIRRAQALVRSYIPGDESLADELVADRRRDARDE